MILTAKGDFPMGKKAITCPTCKRVSLRGETVCKGCGAELPKRRKDAHAEKWNSIKQDNRADFGRVIHRGATLLRHATPENLHAYNARAKSERLAAQVRANAVTGLPIP